MEKFKEARILLKQREKKIIWRTKNGDFVFIWTIKSTTDKGTALLGKSIPIEDLEQVPDDSTVLLH